MANGTYGRTSSTWTRVGLVFIVFTFVFIAVSYLRVSNDDLIMQDRNAHLTEIVSSTSDTYATIATTGGSSTTGLPPIEKSNALGADVIVLPLNFEGPAPNYTHPILLRTPPVTPPKPVVWIYSTGHLRSYLDVCGAEYVNYAHHMNDSLDHIAMYMFLTWSIYEHTQRSWWKGANALPENRSEVVEYLRSPSNPLFSYPYLTYLVEDYDSILPQIPQPKIDITPWLLANIMCATYYTLNRIHDAAVEEATLRGIEMNPWDIIVKTRPDVRCNRLFNATEVTEFFKENPYTMLSTSVDNDWWRSNYASDVAYIISRAAMERIRQNNFAPWFEEKLQTENIYHTFPNPPEYVVRRYFEAIGISVKFVTGQFACDILRRPDRIAVRLGTWGVPTDYNVVHLF